MEEVQLSGGTTGVKVSGAKGTPPPDTYKVSLELIEFVFHVGLRRSVPRMLMGTELFQ